MAALAAELLSASDRVSERLQPWGICFSTFAQANLLAQFSTLVEDVL